MLWIANLSSYLDTLPLLMLPPVTKNLHEPAIRAVQVRNKADLGNSGKTKILLNSHMTVHSEPL